MFATMEDYYVEVEKPENTTLNISFKAKYTPLNEVLNAIRPGQAWPGLHTNNRI